LIRPTLDARSGEVVKFDAAEITAARERGGASLRVADRVGLDREVARLILAYSPKQRELAEDLLVPVTK
jgi:hypothetical protein